VTSVLGLSAQRPQRNLAKKTRFCGVAMQTCRYTDGHKSSTVQGCRVTTMKAICLRITALACSCLLTVPFSAFAQTNGKTTAAYPNKAAIASYSDVPASWVQGLGFSPDWVQGNAQDRARPPSSNAAALSLQDLASSLSQAQGNAPQQTKPPSSNVPSLQGLGFSPSAIHGSAKLQALLNKRSHMLQIHQKLGLLTTIPLAATVFTGLGAKGHHGMPGSATGRDVHAGLGALTVSMYAATAYYAIRAPKVPGIKTRGNVRLHKAMAWIHGPGMILTPILGSIAFSQLSRGERVHGIAQYHSIVAYTTVAAYGVAILSVSLNKF
jgi:hypothetical protein